MTPPPYYGRLLIGAWAPACFSIVYVNASTGAITPTGGEPEINPACAANVTSGQIYSPQQHGLLYALLLAAVYMLTAVGYWGSCVAVLTRRIASEKSCPPLRPVCARRCRP